VRPASQFDFGLEKYFLQYYKNHFRQVSFRSELAEVKGRKFISQGINDFMLIAAGYCSGHQRQVT